MNTSNGKSKSVRNKCSYVSNEYLDRIVSVIFHWVCLHSAFLSIALILRISIAALKTIEPWSRNCVALPGR